jgi:integrase
MAQTVNQLTATKVQKIKAPGMYPDGVGLYLQVIGEAKSWILRFSLRGKARQMGLGSLRKVSLADARRKAADCHKLLDDHIDPIEHRAKERAANALASATKTVTFAEAAAIYIASHRRGLKNLKHAAQWAATIATYAEPIIGKRDVADINTSHVLQILEPIWTTKPETAKRVRGRIESILDWARVSGHRSGENPARWRGNLDKLLPKQSKVRKVKHHPAMLYDALPAFMQKLRNQDGNTARALEFCILTAARTNEILKARPPEIDRGEKLWTVPGERMKGGQEHRVPLCKRALELAGKGSDSYLFPSRYHPDKSLSNMAMLMMLDDLGHGDVTVHGFRSTFKDWARDRTRFDNYVVEAALAHASGDKVEAAYARSDVLAKRRKLMDAWAEFCASGWRRSGRVVVSLRTASKQTGGEV